MPDRDTGILWGIERLYSEIGVTICPLKYAYTLEIATLKEKKREEENRGDRPTE